MRAIPYRRVVSTVITLTGFTAAGCQLDKLIIPPNDPMPPVLSISRIDEAAAVGSLAPRGLQISLTNPGSYAVSWTARVIGQSTWLVLDHTADTAPSSLGVSLTPEGLEIGTYIDTIAIARTDRPDAYINVPVEFVILPCNVVDIIGDTQIVDEVGDVDCGAPHRETHFAKLYRVHGQPTDSVSVTLQSSDFGALLILSASDDPAQPPLLELTTCHDNPEQACVGYFALADSDPLYIEVTSEQPGASGEFTLQINAPRAPSSPTGLGQFANAQGTPIPEGGTIPNNEMFVQGTVFDIDPMDSVRLEVEVQTSATPFAFAATHVGDLVTAGSAPIIHVTDLLDDTDYKWQARTVDLSGRSSDWLRFGISPVEIDFQVRVADAPYAPSNLGQLKSDIVTPVLPGSSIDEQTIVLAGVVMDNDQNELVRLEVEVRPSTTPFQNTPTGSSVLLVSGDTANVVVGGLTDGVNYHWQARAVDQNGLQGPWAPFGNTHGHAFDFAVDIRANHLFITTQPAGGVAGEPLALLRVEARKPNGSIDRRFNGPLLVNLTSGTGTPGAVLSGVVLVSAQKGVAVFSNLSIDRAGTSYRLTVLTAGLPPILTAPFDIRDPVPTRIAIITQPAARAESGKILAQQPVLEFQDPGGGAVGVSGLEITVSIASGPSGELGGTVKRSAASNGRVTFTDLYLKGTAGAYVLTFADPTGRVPSVTSTPITLITATDIDPASTTATVPDGMVGASTNIIVTTRNASGVSVNGGNAKVAATVTAGSANAGAFFIISTTGDSTFFATYAPTVSGTDTITITVDGVAISGSPFTSVVLVGPANNVEVGLFSQLSMLLQEGLVTRRRVL